MGGIGRYGYDQWSAQEEGIRADLSCLDGGTQLCFGVAYEEAGIESGPVFRSRRGECGKYGDYEHGFLTRMSKVQVAKPELFAKPDSNVFDEYSLGRSSRRSATGRALNIRLDSTIIDTNNRWRVRERAKGSDPNQNMIQHYADVLVLLDALLAFPQAM